MGQKKPLAMVLLCASLLGGAPPVSAANTTSDRESLWGVDATTATADVSDPLEPWNRVMFSLNDALYEAVLHPASDVYAAIVPTGGRQAVERFFQNLLMPVHAVNALLQGKVDQTGIEIGRFVINTTIGGLGLFDVAATHFDLKSHREDFGQTLARYGAGDDVYLMWPLLGPSNLRDTIGTVGDGFLNPWHYYPEESLARAGIEGYSKFNMLSLHTEEIDEFKKASVDPYSAFRNAYLQMRHRKIAE
ncbi:MAG: VacJ family lipoprotein [Magnetococcales bacterium]|nr:VacJ family lipoprotein [Magnetococcales bacterium]